MAEGDGALYDIFKLQLLNGAFNLANGGDTIKVCLVTGHTPDLNAHEAYQDIKGDEETDANSPPAYTTGGETLANQSTSFDSPGDEAVFDGDNITWTALDVGTPSHAIMYDDSGASPPEDYLIAYWELTTASNGGDYTLQFNSEGIVNLS
jgi:hypothetical protein